MWTINYKQTTSRKGVGTLTAINGSFTFSDDQIDTSDSQKVLNFKTKAINRFNAAEAVEAEIAAIQTSIETIFNT